MRQATRRITCLHVALLAISVFVGPGRAEIREEVRADWAFQFRTMGYGRLEGKAPPRPRLLRNDETTEDWRRRIDHPPLLDANARFLETDRDQVDVVLRRTTALLEYWRSRDPGAARWRAFEAPLAHLGEKARATAPDLAGTNSVRQSVYFQLCALRRRIVMANPLLDFDDILFNEFNDVGNYVARVHPYGEAGGGLYVIRDFKSNQPQVVDLAAVMKPENGDYTNRFLSGGVFQAPELSFDGKTIYFAWADPGRTSRRARGKGHGKGHAAGPYKLFRVNTDGTGLRQLTFGRGTDTDPCELPNGRIVFCSSRRRSGDRCCGANRQACFLHSMKPDGSDIVCLSFHETHEWEPSVDNAGMLVYSRWDYVDRPARGPRNLWLCRPDGGNPRAPHGNYGAYIGKGIFDPPIPGYDDSPLYRDWRNGPPLSEVSIRAVPGSHRYLAVAGVHDWNGIGPLVLIDLNKPDDYLHAQLTRVTPEFYEHDNRTRWNMIWATPWPLSEDFYLVNRYESIGILDRFGNFELIYHMKKADALNCAGARHRHVGCWNGMGTGADLLGKQTETDGSRMYWRPLNPIPLRPRTRPPVIPDRTFQTQERRKHPQRRPATLSVMNVYNTDVPLPAGARIKWLRIVQLLPGVSGSTSEAVLRSSVGVVPVEADGSVYCEAPIERGIYFQLLDEQNRAVHGMLSDTYVHRGEHLSCLGCHERTEQTATPRQVPRALRRAPSRIEPEFADPSPTVYGRHVEPILDGFCVRCHRERKRGPEMLTMGSLAARNWISFVTFPGRPRTPSRTRPGRVGSATPRLVSHIEKHRDAFTDTQRRRLHQWLDLNCPINSLRSTLGKGIAYSQGLGQLHWPPEVQDFTPLNPMGIERIAALPARSPEPDEWVAALTQAADYEERAALLDWLHRRLEPARQAEPSFCNGREQDLYALLIPMLTSRRNRIRDSAIAWLRHLPGPHREVRRRECPVDVQYWKALYEKTYPGRPLDVPTVGREQILLVKPMANGRAGYRLEGEPTAVADPVALETELKARAKVAGNNGRQPVVIIETPARKAISRWQQQRQQPTEDWFAVEVEDAKLAAWRAVGRCEVWPPGHFGEPHRLESKVDKDAPPATEGATAPRIGVPMPSDAGALVSLLAHEFFTVRLKARRTLVEMGPVAVPHLRKGTRHDDSSVRYHALLALREVGIEADTLCAVAVPLLADEDGAVRSLACDLSLRNMEPTQGNAVTLVRHLHDSGMRDRIVALLQGWLKRKGSAREEIAAGLRRTLTASEGTTARSLITLLITSDINVAFDRVLAEYNRDPAGNSAWFQKTILGGDFPAGDVVPVLEREIVEGTHGSWHIAQLATLVSKYGPAASCTTPALTKALHHPAQHTRLYAARALGDIGPAAAAALPVLQRLSKADFVPRVRDAAAAASRKIGGPQPATNGHEDM